MRLQALKMTCMACPSQWHGITTDNRYVYVRYRWGTLSVGLGNTHDEAIQNHGNFLLTYIGDGLDGTMDTAEMLRHTKLEYTGDSDEITITYDH